MLPEQKYPGDSRVPALRRSPLGPGRCRSCQAPAPAAVPGSPGWIQSKGLGCQRSPGQLRRRAAVPASPIRQAWTRPLPMLHPVGWRLGRRQFPRSHSRDRPQCRRRRLETRQYRGRSDSDSLQRRRRLARTCPLLDIPAEGPGRYRPAPRRSHLCLRLYWHPAPATCRP